jgi:hypothetical protein
LSSKKTGDFDVLSFMVPVNKLDRVVGGNVKKVFLFPVINALQVNYGFLLLGFFPAG